MMKCRPVVASRQLNMRKLLALLLKICLLCSLSFLTFSLPLALFLLFPYLHGIVILLIFNLAINSFTGVLGILIGCRSTIISTALVEIVLVLLIVGSNLLSVPGLGYMFAGAVALFALQIFYSSLIKVEKEDKFVWAAYYQNDYKREKRERLVVGESV